MHLTEINTTIRVTLCGFPILFSEWLAFHLSKKKKIEISGIIHSHCSNILQLPEEIGLVLLRIQSQNQIQLIQRTISRNRRVLVWWSGQTLNDEIIIELVNAGASGVLGDHHLLEEIELAILNAGTQGLHFNDILSTALLHYCRKQKIIRVNHLEELPYFSDREKRVIELRRQGNTSKEISQQLFLSKKTIDKVFCDLYRRFECNNFFDVLRLYENGNSELTISGEK
ncbi:MAG TPA: LuxR C-terminal-related transcriptional regulator [Bacteroidia bacterium]|nr:LuxR C-terminal-related transcriptional regulator [Bacteroidia bacterium]